MTHHLEHDRAPLLRCASRKRPARQAEDDPFRDLELPARALPNN